MFYIINTMKKQTLLYYICTYDTKKVSIWTCPPPSPHPPVHYFIICNYAPDINDYK